MLSTNNCWPHNHIHSKREVHHAYRMRATAAIHTTADICLGADLIGWCIWKVTLNGLVCHKQCLKR